MLIPGLAAVFNQKPAQHILCFPNALRALAWVETSRAPCRDRTKQTRGSRPGRASQSCRGGAAPLDVHFHHQGPRVRALPSGHPDPLTLQEALLLGGQSAGFHRGPRDSDRGTAGPCSAISLPARPSVLPAGQEPGARGRLPSAGPGLPSGLVPSTCVSQ